MLRCRGGAGRCLAEGGCLFVGEGEMRHEVCKHRRGAARDPSNTVHVAAPPLHAGPVDEFRNLKEMDRQIRRVCVLDLNVESA